jgi:hypothetical protein
MYLFSALFVSSIAVKGMEIINHDDDLAKKVLYHLDILPQINQCLCYDYGTRFIRKDFRALSLVNKFFYDYYSAEKNKQTIIRIIARNNNYYDAEESIANLLGCHTISKKIKYFIDIAENKDKRFRQEDLKEKWYLNATSDCCNSLVYIAIEKNNLETAQQIVGYSGLDLTCNELKYLASLIDRKQLYYSCNNDVVAVLMNLYAEVKNQILLREQINEI